MAKQDFPPIFSAGIHSLTIDDFESRVVMPFPSDLRRIALFQSFLTWINELKILGITGEIWVDGSYITEKPNPDDIDLYFFNARMSRQLNATESKQLEKLIDHDEVRVKFSLDLYLEAPAPYNSSPLDQKAYWSGLFGFQHDRSKAKGFAELII